MNTPALKLEAISKSFYHDHSQTILFDDLSFAFHAGTSYALMGPSGVGKSTLLHIAAGIESPDSGFVSINGKTIDYKNFEDRINALHANIGIIFQQPSLIGELSAIENVMLSAIARNDFSNESKIKALELLGEIGLEAKANSSPNTLSGGQQHRVAILRSLFHRPSFLLADEPTGNLDEASANQIMSILAWYQKKYTMGLIVSTHDIKVAEQCDVILKIQDGKLTKISH